MTTFIDERYAYITKGSFKSFVAILRKYHEVTISEHKSKVNLVWKNDHDVQITMKFNRVQFVGNNKFAFCNENIPNAYYRMELCTANWYAAKGKGSRGIGIYMEVQQWHKTITQEVY